MLDLLSKIGPAKGISNKYPLSMEELDVNEGFVLYRTTLKQDYSGVTISIKGIRDRGYVLINGVYN